MGKLAQTNDPEVVKVIDEIFEKTKKAGLLLGTASGPYDVWKKRGLNWIALTSDCGSMGGGFRQVVANEADK